MLPVMAIAVCVALFAGLWTVRQVCVSAPAMRAFVALPSVKPAFFRPLFSRAVSVRRLCARPAHATCHAPGQGSC